MDSRIAKVYGGNFGRLYKGPIWSAIGTTFLFTLLCTTGIEIVFLITGLITGLLGLIPVVGTIIVFLFSVISMMIMLYISYMFFAPVSVGCVLQKMWGISANQQTSSWAYIRDLWSHPGAKSLRSGMSSKVLLGSLIIGVLNSVPILFTFAMDYKGDYTGPWGALVGLASIVSVVVTVMFSLTAVYLGPAVFAAIRLNDVRFNHQNIWQVCSQAFRMNTGHYFMLMLRMIGWYIACCFWIPIIWFFPKMMCATSLCLAGGLGINIPLDGSAPEYTSGGQYQQGQGQYPQGQGYQQGQYQQSPGYQQTYAQGQVYPQGQPQGYPQGQGQYQQGQGYPQGQVYQQPIGQPVNGDVSHGQSGLGQVPYVPNETAFGQNPYGQPGVPGQSAPPQGINPFTQGQNLYGQPGVPPQGVNPQGSNPFDILE